MREIRLYGSEGGGAAALPTPIFLGMRSRHLPNITNRARWIRQFNADSPEENLTQDARIPRRGVTATWAFNPLAPHYSRLESGPSGRTHSIRFAARVSGRDSQSSDHVFPAPACSCRISSSARGRSAGFVILMLVSLPRNTVTGCPNLSTRQDSSVA